MVFPKNVVKSALIYFFCFYLGIQFQLFTDVKKVFEESLEIEEGTARKTHYNESTSQDFYFDKIRSISYNDASNMKREPRTHFDFDSEYVKEQGGLFDSDRELLRDLYLSVNSVFEFGIGESTGIAALAGVPRYAGVDSDPEWVTKSRDKSKKDHFRFYFADIGATKKWGHPINRKLQKIIYDYQIAPLDAEKEAFDVYLVDGRYRIACFCASLLHALKHRADMSKVKVAIHDAKRYSKILDPIVNRRNESEKLIVYQLKVNTKEKEIFDLWSTYSRNPS